MRLHEVILKNFRGYYGETRIAISDLTALIGKNDVGKSTILEALDIFFNQSKIDATDKNIFHVDEETVIGCVFNDLPAEIALENATTSFSKEYLLNQEGNLEVLKKYSSNGKPTIWICANHPSNDGFNDLLLKKNNELKMMIRAAHLEDSVNLSINSAMRATLWTSLGNAITFGTKEISADQADEKKLWPKIEPLLPTYRLFKADRPSSEDDKEAQDPMQHAMKAALEEQSEQLTAIANEVQRKVSEVATNTIQKLKEFDPDLAATLTPRFKKEPTWEKAFSFSLTGDNSIPLNNRGSGIRRLVLFSFFRATTESSLFEGKSIIYAIEEPETSQHPDAQRMIVRTLREMTEKNGCQVIITTHVPGLAGLLPIESLRYITNGEGYPEVEVGTTDGVLQRIANTLGVLPDLTPPLMPQHHNVKLVVCVEGPNDVSFLTKISHIAHQEYPDIIDLNLSPAVVVIPLGGGALKEWVNHNYLQKLGTPEYHIYDSDNTHAHAATCDRVNRRDDGSSARETTKREMENYIHADVVKELFNVDIEITDTMDVPTEISTLIRETNPEGPRPDTVKKKLNSIGAEKMTIDLLHSRDPDDEILGWLREITAFVGV